MALSKAEALKTEGLQCVGGFDWVVLTVEVVVVVVVEVVVVVVVEVVVVVVVIVVVVVVVEVVVVVVVNVVVANVVVVVVGVVSVEVTVEVCALEAWQVSVKTTPSMLTCAGWLPPAEASATNWTRMASPSPVLFCSDS